MGENKTQDPIWGVKNYIFKIWFTGVVFLFIFCPWVMSASLSGMNMVGRPLEITSLENWVTDLQYLWNLCEVFFYKFVGNFFCPFCRNSKGGGGQPSTLFFNWRDPLILKTALLQDLEMLSVSSSPSLITQSQSN